MKNQYCKITLENLKSDIDIRTGYSRAGLKSLFGSARVHPIMELDRTDLMKGFVAAKSRMSISGAQPKRSAVINNNRIELSDTGGQYIIKPSPEEFPHLAEVEHACMLITEALSGKQLKVAEHGLVELKSGELVYITKRYDRLANGGKLHQEQMDAAMGVSDKYHVDTSYERIGRFIKETVTVPLPSLMAFYEQVLISYLIGNNDLHIRNLGLMSDKQGSVLGLTPAYDIVAAALYEGGGTDFLALSLTINDEENQKGATRGMVSHGFYTGFDFEDFGTGIGLGLPVVKRLTTQVLKNIPKAKSIITNSFIPIDLKEKLIDIVHHRETMIRILD